MLSQYLLLHGLQIMQPALSQIQQRQQFCMAEGAMFRSPLDLDEPAFTSHYDIKIHPGLAILVVIQVKDGDAIEYPNTHCSNALWNYPGRIYALRCQRLDRIDEGDEASRNTESPRAAIRFQNITVDGDRPWPQRLDIDDRSQAAPNESLNFR